jgi:hypothetical protein
VVTDLCQRLVDARVPGLHFYTLNNAAATKAICDRLGTYARVSHRAAGWPRGSISAWALAVGRARHSAARSSSSFTTAHAVKSSPAPPTLV